jgi:hypothetical protein
MRILLVVAALMSAGAAQVAPVRADSLFQFSSDDFWLNLHHYLYVDALSIWQLPLSGARLPPARLKHALLEICKPYLDGRGTRDEALGGLLEAAAGR